MECTLLHPTLAFQESCTRLLDERSHHTRRCVTVTELLAMTK